MFSITRENEKQSSVDELHPGGALLRCAANASVIITLDQVGPNVVATGSGTIDLTDPTFLATAPLLVAYIYPLGANLLVSSAISVLDFDIYAGISGAHNYWKSRYFHHRLHRYRRCAGISGLLEMLSVPHDYVSGTSLCSTATWDNTTIAAFGADPGIYTWTWGTGANADSLTLIVTPEPGSALLLCLGFVGLALLKWRSSIRCPRWREAMVFVTAIVSSQEWIRLSEEARQGISG